jgi:hypothetical protein
VNSACGAQKLDQREVELPIAKLPLVALRISHTTFILQALNKPHRKANLDTGTQLNENHASTISSGNRNGTAFDSVSALCTSTFQTRLANKFHGLHAHAPADGHLDK